MICNSCNHTNRSSSGFCSKCGNALGGNICKSCNHTNRSSSGFCSKCGNVLGGNVRNISMTTAHQQETVVLDSLDGFEFEVLCERIFQRAGWGRVQRIGGIADGGRDLIIHTPNNEKIIVECKHQPRSSIGRPIVQKLHSAIISEHTNKGIIVTTGKFSKDAIAYANNLSDGTNIELFGLMKLTELAQKGKIEISTSGEDLRVFTFPVLGKNDLENKFQSVLKNSESFPKSTTELLEVNVLRISLRSTYEAIVDIHQDFVTSAGLIHQIHRNSLSYFYDGENGYLLQFESQYLPTYNSTILFDESKTDDSIIRSEFRLNKTTLTDKIKESIVQEYTINVQYWGRNNRSYNKLCQPNQRNVTINDLNQILLPEYTLRLKFLKKNYSCILLESKSRINISNTEFFKCSSCRETITGKFLLCNSCGNVCHTPKQKNHSHICENCQKTLCPDCAYYTRKYLFFKKILCEPCMDQSSKKKQKLI
jgi:restriction system protein